MRASYLLPWCLLLIVGCSRSTASWTEQAKSANPAQRLHAVHALRERVKDKQAVVPVLVHSLQDENSYVRRDAARALGHFGTEAGEAIPALVGCLQDKEPSVRKAAQAALERIDPTAASKGKAKIPRTR